MDTRYNDPSDYVMVGGEYYRKCRTPYDMSSDKVELLPWPRSQINEDFRQCPEKKREIERYDGFCNIPEHLNYMSVFFRENVAMVTNDELRSHFNSSWVVKLVVMIDETLLNRKEDSERIKALSTARMGMLESKGKDRRSVRMFLKIVLCSNNPDCPVWIEEDDDRYRVLEVPSLQKKDPFLFDKLVAEIPAFMHFLINRTMKYPEPQERMWFPMKELETDALKRIKRSCGPTGECELAEAILSVMDFYEMDTLCYTQKDLKDLADHYGVKIKGTVRDIVRKRWGLLPAPSNMSYDKYNFYSLHDILPAPKEKGRYFTFHRDALEKLLKEMEWVRKKP